MQIAILKHLCKHMKEEGLDAGIDVKKAADGHNNPQAAEALRKVCDKVFYDADISEVRLWLGRDPDSQQRGEALDWAWRTSWQRGDARSVVPSWTESCKTSDNPFTSNGSTMSGMNSNPAYTPTGPGFTLSSVLPPVF